MEKACIKEPDHLCYKRKIGLYNNKGFINIVEIDSIVFIQASRSYSEVFLINGEKITVSKPLKFFDAKLCEGHFLRCHRSYLINKDCIRQILRSEKKMILKGGKHVLCTDAAIQQLCDEILI